MRMPVGTRDRAGENHRVNSPLPMAVERSLAFRWIRARARAFMAAATGSIRSVSSLCFLESLMSP